MIRKHWRIITTIILLVIVASVVYSHVNERKNVERLLGTSIPMQAEHIRYSYRRTGQFWYISQEFELTFVADEDLLSEFLHDTCFQSMSNLEAGMNLEVYENYWEYPAESILFSGRCTSEYGAGMSLVITRYENNTYRVDIIGGYTP